MTDLDPELYKETIELFNQFIVFTARLYEKALKQAEKEVDTSFSVNKYADDAKYCEAAADKVNATYDNMRRYIAKEVQKKVKKDGLFVIWREFEGLSLSSGEKRLPISFPFRYFGSPFNSNYAKVDDKYVACSTTRYMNYYSNEDIPYFDKEFQKLDESIKEHLENEKKALETIKCEQKDVDMYSIGSCISNSVTGVLKILVQAVIAAVIGAIGAAILIAATDNETLGVIAGIIVFAIAMIIFWNKFEDDEDFMDWGLRRDHIRGLASAKERYNRYSSLVKKDKEIMNSSEYKKAKERDQQLRDEDTELANEWHMKWYEHAKFREQLKKG